MDISLLVHDYQSPDKDVKGPPRKRTRPLEGVHDGAHPAKRHAASLPSQKEELPIRQADNKLPTPADTNADTPSPVPSSPLSYRSRTPSLSPPRDTPVANPADSLAEKPAEESAALSEAPKETTGKSKTAQKRPSLHPNPEARREQARLAGLKAELARIYKTEDRTKATPKPASLGAVQPLSPSLSAGSFVRYMARVYMADIEDVRIQRYLRDKVMATAHFNELMIWHRRALKERSRNPTALQLRSSASPSPGTANPNNKHT
ncbi:hypothetical protein F503_01026 [Ophiostoma piceae UAMH 11346]|uniref:Uncharacterized protein n=1 Tax=Ophiostoma piceae (strain UAMH 11346) TaxID=1262450 RepID=S3CNZ1_OPHP1|nr:hypothetical protein F503_01026 [Ophiostoma piceae UAMH 11346]